MDDTATKAWVTSKEVCVFRCDISMLVGICFRSTVQMLMSVLDNDGAKRRRCHRFKRRVYQNKEHNSLKT